MEHVTAVPQPGTPENPTDLGKLLQECHPDREALIRELEPLFRELWTEGLKAVESALPDFRQAGSADQKLHVRLRNMLLNKGNAQVREVRNILRNYYLKQMFARQLVEKIHIGEKVKIPSLVG